MTSSCSRSLSRLSQRLTIRWSSDSIARMMLYRVSAFRCGNLPAPAPL
ncbi:hypothetical protein GX411_01190 [Candidatus Fermentibacteria bacterium]|nr:hypothetical protein [Candidatus Fermentibacteria bacterium]